MKFMKRILLFLFIFLVPFVSGIGISPPEHELDFKPGLEKEIKYTLVNTQNTPIEARVNVSGKLAPYVEAKQKEISVAPSKAKTVKLELSLPEKLEPGWNNANVKFLDNTKRGSGMFGVKVAVRGKLKVFVPFPEFYAEPKLNVGNINKGEDINYKVTINNRGEKDIQNSHLSLKFMYNNEKKKEINFNNINIKSLEQHTIQDSFSSEGLKKGIYKVQGVYDYGKINEFNTTFRIGSYEIFLRNYSTRLYSDQVTPLDIRVKSNWNGKIKKAYVTVEINDSSYRSIEKTLQAFEEKTFTPYINDETLKEGGEYEANITVHYGGKTTSKIVTLSTIDKKEKKEDQPSTLLPPVLTSTSTYLIVIAVLLAIMNIILLRSKK